MFCFNKIENLQLLRIIEFPNIGVEEFNLGQTTLEKVPILIGHVQIDA